MELGLSTMHRSKIMKVVKNPTYKPIGGENQDSVANIHVYTGSIAKLLTT